jgi:hypothetical protein
MIVPDDGGNWYLEGTTPPSKGGRPSLFPLAAKVTVVLSRSLAILIFPLSCDRGHCVRACSRGAVARPLGQSTRGARRPGSGASLLTPTPSLLAVPNHILY